MQNKALRIENSYEKSNNQGTSIARLLYNEINFPNTQENFVPLAQPLSGCFYISTPTP